MKVTLCHAYSSLNSGDGLLVELAKALIEEAYAPSTIELVAIDPESFDDWTPPPRPWAREPRGTSSRLGLLASGVAGPSRQVKEVLESADVVVAVGGGYLRGGTPLEALKTSAAHLRQLKEVSSRAQASIYLPQSIGPFASPTDAWVAKHLSRIDRVMVRDDISHREFDLPNVRRYPDLALLKIGEDMVGNSDRVLDGPAIFVPRALHHGEAYTQQWRSLASMVPQHRWAAQATGRGNDDAGFIRSLTHQPFAGLLVTLQDAENGVVVSARLHGALQSILRGVPAIHLSYERKGFAAFQDLGLGEFVFNARTMDAARIAAAIAEVRANPAEYWSKIEAARAGLQAARRTLIEDMRHIL